MYDKNELRERVKKQRKSLTHEEIEKKSNAIACRLYDTAAYKNARCICVYMAAFNEPRTADIISRALSDGKKVCVPVTNEADCTLTLSYIQGTDSLVRGAYGIYEPAVIDGADTSAPDMITVPGIVFDKSGNRIGFGKGFYDRLLSEARAVRVGICYAFQLSENISPDKHDIPMDIIITEEETLICKPTVILPHGAQRLQQ